jgi:uncharacterized caspase-like protein
MYMLTSRAKIIVRLKSRTAGKAESVFMAKAAMAATLEIHTPTVARRTVKEMRCATLMVLARPVVAMIPLCTNVS